MHECEFHRISQYAFQAVRKVFNQQEQESKIMKSFKLVLTTAALFLMVFHSSSCRPDDSIVAVDPPLKAARIETLDCPLHGTEMKHKLAIEDEAGFYHEWFLDDHWKKFPHDGYLYNVCQTNPGTMIWVCPDCQRYSRKARVTGRMR